MDYEQKGDLDYRRGGDTLSDLGELYDTEIPWIFQCMNDIRRHKVGTAGTVPQQIVIQDGSLYVVNDNNELVRIGSVSFGLGLIQPGQTVLTNDDIAQSNTDAGKIVTLNQDGLIDYGTTQGAARLAGKRVDVSEIQDGQVLVYREATNTFVGEQKGTIGAGKTLTFLVDGKSIGVYDGSEAATIDLPLNILGRKTTYAVGDRVKTTAIPSYFELECITAGETATNEPDWSTL